MSQSRELRTEVRHVLLAEDNRADVFLIEEALRAYGVNVTLQVVPDGEAAVRYVLQVDEGQAQRPDLILLDLNLPKRNGFEVLSRIRASATCGAVPVVIVTSSNADLDKEETDRLGANAFFRKPSTYEQFMEIGELVKDILVTD